MAARLAELGHPSTLYAYPSKDHLFTHTEFKQAVARDTEFFRNLIR
jgi:acetyl esterase/lipase